ncbi:hypothetical protein RHGRI_003990 [Rhododendron griersonianum]|uniref:NADP-dependent oxidoreductase domain-containing protein n=1 Tax=Rhododendron griersonianum TaxID=479676 RepID=A0AAV6L989_9ERIC|nr:hypothetical protein RHGRI_003990 [Rhododendron griersonianum]
MEMERVGRMKLGSQGLEVSAQGLGCMGMSAVYGPPKAEEEMIKLIHHAINSGVTFLDTSDVYGDNETLLGKAMKGGMREKVELATKFGITFHGKIEMHGDPGYVRAAYESSLKQLGIDCIDLYYQHRVDIRVPIEVTMGELKKLVEEGKIKYVGLSEVCASTIRRAHAVHPVTAIQLEWSLWSRDVEEEIVPTCRELGIGIVAYSPLGLGFFASGAKLIENLATEDFRKSLPRFQPENVEHNKATFERVNEMAAKRGCTPGQLALAWVHHQGNDVCPIPGTTKIENFDQNVGALSVKLTPEEMAELESIADAVKGGRDGGVVPTWKNSETPPLSSWMAEELGIEIVAYSLLGLGFFASGTNLIENLATEDFRKSLPRFQPENVEHNKTMFEIVNEMAAKKGSSPGQVALGWVHHQGNDVCPIPGSTKIENFDQNVGALSVKLMPEEMAELESIADAVKGGRDGGVVPTWKNSETPPLSSWMAK